MFCHVRGQHAYTDYGLQIFFGATVPIYSAAVSVCDLYMFLRACMMRACVLLNEDTGKVSIIVRGKKKIDAGFWLGEGTQF